MRPFQTILFDLDGTLLDSVDLIVDSYHHTLAAHRLTPMTRDEILAGLGTTLYAVFGKMTDDADTLASWIATYREYNLTHHDARARAYPGVVEMVRRIADSGFRLGMVTSKARAGAERGLRVMGLDGTMEIIIGADNVVKPKPDPEPVLMALDMMGVSAETTLFVGDSHHDVHSGRGAGVKTAGVTWGPFDRGHLEIAAPDYYCETPADLLRLLGLEASR